MLVNLLNSFQELSVTLNQINYSIAQPGAVKQTDRNKHV